MTPFWFSGTYINTNWEWAQMGNPSPLRVFLRCSENTVLFVLNSYIYVCTPEDETTIRVEAHRKLQTYDTMFLNAL